MANRAYKFRIYPNDEQKILFAKTFGCVRMVYNHWLDRKIRQYEENKTNVTYTICAKEMAAMKKTEEYGFLKEVDSIALQQSLRHLDTAFQNFFKQPKTGFPRFKSKKRNKNSYSTVCINGNITLSNGYLRLPKIGQVRLKQHRSVPEEYRLLLPAIPPLFFSSAICQTSSVPLLLSFPYCHPYFPNKKTLIAHHIR